MTVLIGEDRRWQAWNKPAGIPVFPPHGDPTGDCLLHRAGLSAAGWELNFAGGVAHRLDTPTSGQVLSARTADDLAWLRGLFRDGELQKVYRFVSSGQVSWDDNAVNTPLAHHKSKRSIMVCQRGKNTPHRGKWYAASTRFKRLGSVSGGGSLWEAVITTGVMHQIRVHAAFVGIPLRGDRRYGGGRPDNEEVPFLLHHVGLTGPGLCPPSAPLPDYWPNPE